MNLGKEKCDKQFENQEPPERSFQLQVRSLATPHSIFGEGQCRQ
jgi:hypothetical protein